MEAGGCKIRKAAVEESLRLPARTLPRGRLCALRGKPDREGAIDDMRIAISVRWSGIRG